MLKQLLKTVVYSCLLVPAKQAQDAVKEIEATRAGQYYVNQRWLGGTLINWTTISKAVLRD